MALTRELDIPHEWMMVAAHVGTRAALFTGDIAGADRRAPRGTRPRAELVVLPIASEVLRGLAAVAARNGDLDRAARLCGAADAHRFGQPAVPLEARVRDTFLAPARARHGAEAWDAAAREGAALGLDGAIALALGEPPSRAAAETLVTVR